MSTAADSFADLMSRHRSVRQYSPRPLDPGLVDRVLVQALHGSSSSGNLNMVSVVKTADVERKQHLHTLHAGQPMVLQAPLVLTFCADSFRTREWLALRRARMGFGDFVSYHVAAFDALILAQTAALAFESHGLGICYMGSTLHAMAEIAEFLELPDHCVPVTSMVVGWPAEAPAQRDRLPGSSWIHDERYRRPDDAALEAGFADRERSGRERYLAMGEGMARAWAEHGISSLAQFYTSKLKYDPDRFRQDSDSLRALLATRGFMP